MARAKVKTVLVVDDEPHLRHYLRMVLEDAGYCVLTAADGLEGLNLARAHRPDLVSVDLAMPRKTGYRLLVEMRREEGLKDIPVVIVTAHARDSVGVRALTELRAAGYDLSRSDYLEKPVSASTYLAAVARALGVEGREDSRSVGELRELLRNRIEDAGPEALKRALEALARSLPGEEER